MTDGIRRSSQAGLLSFSERFHLAFGFNLAECNRAVSRQPVTDMKIPSALCTEVFEPHLANEYLRWLEQTTNNGNLVLCEARLISAMSAGTLTRDMFTRVVFLLI